MSTGKVCDYFVEKQSKRMSTKKKKNIEKKVCSIRVGALFTRLYLNDVGTFSKLGPNEKIGNI